MKVYKCYTLEREAIIVLAETEEDALNQCFERALTVLAIKQIREEKLT